MSSPFDVREDEDLLPVNSDPPANLDPPPINQALIFNRGAANQLNEEDDLIVNEEEGSTDHDDLQQQLCNDHQQTEEEDDLLHSDEPSNFQAWYVRAARNHGGSHSRQHTHHSTSSEQDPDIQDNVRETDSEERSPNCVDSDGGGAATSTASTVAASSLSIWDNGAASSLVTVNGTSSSASWPVDPSIPGSSSWSIDGGGVSRANLSSVPTLPWLVTDPRRGDVSDVDSADNDVGAGNLDNQEVKYRSSENRDLSLLNRADRTERLDRLYRSLSLEQSDQSTEAPVNENRLPEPQSMISNVNLSSLGAIPRGERRNAAYLMKNVAQASVSNQASANPNPALPNRGPSPGGGGAVVNRGAEALYNWQASKSSVHERFSFMFNNELLADIHFKVGRPGLEQRIPAHKFVLSVGSAVFDAMFNSALAMTEDEIVLPDVEPQAFLALLNFLYSDEVQIGPETVMSTLYTAKKYAVPTLERHCVDFLKKNLSPDNACMLLTQARLFDEPQLASLCLEVIDKNTPEALSADGFTDLDLCTLSVVLDRDTLRIKESKLFCAVLRWAETQCQRKTLTLSGENKRNILGRLLFQIRFPLMSVKEFAQGPAQSGVLTDKETVSLFLHYTVNLKPPDGFLDVPRCSMSGQELSICRFQQIESRWGYSGSSDKIRFIVDSRIFVVGFGLYGSIHGPSEYDVTIQLLHTGSGRILGSNEITFNSDGSNSCFRVMFKEPLEVQAGTNYTAVATLKGLDSHYGTKGQRKVSLECHSGEKVTFQFSYAAGQNNGTSVEDGQIPEIIFYI